MGATINMPSPTHPGIGAISEGLGAIQQIYGIQGAAQAAAQIAKRNDPNSPESVIARNELLGSYDQMHKKGTINDQEYSAINKALMGAPGDANSGVSPSLAMSAAQIEKNPQMSQALEVWKTGVNADAMRDRMMTMNQTKQQNSAMAAAKAFESDPVIKQANMQDAQAQKDLNTLYNRKTLDPQTYAELQKGMANMISGGGASSVSTENRQVFESLSNKLTSLDQMVQNKKLDVGSPEVLDAMRDGFNQFQLASRKNRLDQANQIATGLNPMGLDYIQNTIDAKLNNYSGSVKNHPYFKQNTIGGAVAQRSFDTPSAPQAQSQQPQGAFDTAKSFLHGLVNPQDSAQAGGGNAFQSHPQDSDAVSWAKQNPQDPRSSKILQMNGVH